MKDSSMIKLIFVLLILFIAFSLYNIFKIQYKVAKKELKYENTNNIKTQTFTFKNVEYVVFYNNSSLQIRIPLKDSIEQELLKN